MTSDGSVALSGNVGDAGASEISNRTEKSRPAWLLVVIAVGSR